jgi:hypothetical protein
MLVTMTDKDIYRLGIIQRVHDHTLLQREAARLLELTVRQVQRVLRRCMSLKRPLLAVSTTDGCNTMGTFNFAPPRTLLLNLDRYCNG